MHCQHYKRCLKNTKTVKCKQWKCELISCCSKKMSVIFLLFNVEVTHINDIAIYICDFYTPHSYIWYGAQCTVHKILGKQKTYCHTFYPHLRIHIYVLF